MKPFQGRGWGWAALGAFAIGVFVTGLEVGRGGRASIVVNEGLASGVTALDKPSPSGTTLFTTNAEGNALFVWTYNTRTKLYDVTRFDFSSKLYEEVKFGEEKK